MGAPFRTPINRDALRARMERAIERLIAALDVLDAAGEEGDDNGLGDEGGLQEYWRMLEAR